MVRYGANVNEDLNFLLQGDLHYSLEALRQDLVPALQMTELLLFDNEL